MQDHPAWGDGGCACGAVRFQVRGTPLRTGLCHCMKCRKAHASPFNFFLIYSPDQVDISGETSAWESSPGIFRHFCIGCGSRIAELDGREVELYAGTFDDGAGGFEPQYESWIIHREPWLRPLPLPQFTRDRVTSG